MQNACYGSDHTDAQRHRLRHHLPKPARRGSPPTDPREFLDAMLTALSTGRPWRLLPNTFPPCQTVYHVFQRRCRDGAWDYLKASLRALVRAAAGRDCRPIAGILDSQSVKSDPHGGAVGYDAGKKIRGRKRHLLVDTLGLVLGVHVTPAGTPERAGGLALLATALGWLRWFKRHWVDGGYAGQDFAGQARQQRPRLVIEVVRRSDLAHGFEVLPRRWIVERNFGWLMRHRRLVRDYERSESSAEGWVYLAMVRRLA